MPGKKHLSDAVRARIIVDVISGNYVELHDLAKRYGTSKSTITRIKNNIDPDLLLRNETERREIETSRRELEEERRSIPHLVTELLMKSLDAAARIAEQVQDKDWLNKQTASQLAELYDSFSGTSIRILKACEEAEWRRKEWAKENGPSENQTSDEGREQRSSSENDVHLTGEPDHLKGDRASLN